MPFDKYVEKINKRKENLKVNSYQNMKNDKKFYNKFIKERDEIMKEKDIMLKYNFAIDKKLKGFDNELKTRNKYIYLKKN